MGGGITCSLTCLCPLQKPERDEWGNGLTAMQSALQLEKKVNQALLDIHKVASEKGDPHVSFEDHVLMYITESIPS